MSVEYKAMIVKGYELADGWEAVIDAEYVMAHEDYFIEADAYQGEKVIFGSVLDSVESGDWTEYNTYIDSDTENILSEFAKQYPGSVIYDTPGMYLICKVY